MANDFSGGAFDRNRYRDELRLYGGLQPIRGLIMTADSDDASDPLSVEQLLKITAQAQINDLETNYFLQPKYQEALGYLTGSKTEYTTGQSSHWPNIQLNYRYHANKKEIESAKAAIAAGTTDVEGVAAACHDGWKILVADFIANTSNYWIAKYSDEELQIIKNVFQNSAAMDYSALPEGRLEKEMYRVMANTIIQAYKAAGQIAP